MNVDFALAVLAWDLPIAHFSSWEMSSPSSMDATPWEASPCEQIVEHVKSLSRIRTVIEASARVGDLNGRIALEA